MDPRAQNRLFDSAKPVPVKSTPLRVPRSLAAVGGTIVARAGPKLPLAIGSVASYATAKSTEPSFLDKPTFQLNGLLADLKNM